jgi:glycosyltransferase involved in cell wall biosynthesis
MPLPLTKIAFVANTSWYIYNFKLGLIKALQAEGYDITAIAPNDTYVEKLNSEGISHLHININQRGTNIIEDIKLIYDFYKIFKMERPDLILCYTIKPNIYGSIASRILKILTINNITGLGCVFANENWVTKLVEILYKFSLQKSLKIFFQNYDNMEVFVKKQIVKKHLVDRLPGSGVDLEKYAPRLVIKRNNCKTILLYGRLLWAKGIAEYIEAAKIIKSKYENIEFQLLGSIDGEGPLAVSREQVQRWVDQGLVTYLGFTDNVIDFVTQADCVVLPSYYYEGVPRTLIEAASLAKPIITTSIAGCRDVVEDGINGFLCREKNVKDLVKAIEKMINLSGRERYIMGRKGRDKVTKEFDEKIVIKKHLDIINSLS